MDRLKDKTILVGKDPNKKGMMVAVNVNGQYYPGVLPMDVPQTVSRLRLATTDAETKAHMRIDIDNKGQMRVTNMNRKNATYVNGASIESIKADLNSSIALGRDKYQVNTQAILKAAIQIVSKVTRGSGGDGSMPLSPSYYSISHLQRVWDDYHCSVIEQKKRAREMSAKGRMPMLFTMSAGGIGTLASFIFTEVPPIVKGLSLAVMVIGFALMVININKSKNDRSIEEQEELLDRLMDTYVCPNPKCRRFVGNQPFKLISQMDKCPRCGCNWILDPEPSNVRHW